VYNAWCPYYTETMIETKKVPKNLFDLAKALGRWESEGGSSELQGSELGWSYELLPDCAVLVTEAIANLVAKSLIWAEPKGDIYYRLPLGVRAYAFEKLSSWDR
jgi:hypothetical protein